MPRSETPGTWSRKTAPTTSFSLWGLYIIWSSATSDCWLSAKPKECCFPADCYLLLQSLGSRLLWTFWFDSIEFTSPRSCRWWSNLLQRPYSTVPSEGYSPPPTFIVREILSEKSEKAGFADVKLLNVEGPGFLVADFETRWRDPARREAMLRAARLAEEEPEMMAASSRLLAVGVAPN